MIAETSTPPEVERRGLEGATPGSAGTLGRAAERGSVGDREDAAAPDDPFFISPLFGECRRVFQAQLAKTIRFKDRL